MMLKLIVDKNYFTGMQTQIASQIAALIRSGMLPPGEVLPSEIKLAQHHGISRNVVREAYQILKNKKLIKSDRRREGTVVCGLSGRGTSFEYLRVQLPSEFKERIDVVSLIEDMAPQKFIELALSAKVDKFFKEYLDEYRNSSDSKPLLKVDMNDNESK